MPVNDDKKIFNYLYRRSFRSGVYSFFEIINEAILFVINSNRVEAERLTENKIRNLWSLFLRHYDHDLLLNIVPLFDIVDKDSKTVEWIGINASKLNNNKRFLYKIRPNLYNYIDSISFREYEALGCLLCILLGADNYFLTDPGNEGGIDFIATIKFSRFSHFYFGNKGPLRIIGQCKKYGSKSNIGHMREFVQTLSDVHHVSNRPGEILPSWFHECKGPILGWHIANEGHQSGALNYAKNFGIITSSTKELIDLICKSRKLNPSTNDCNEKINLLQSKINQLLTNG